jgi:mannose-6-phosphate isomerase-like protein (cupin superfamily)
MGYTVVRPDERAFNPTQRGDQSRGIASLSPFLHAMRANIWRFPAGTRSSRHLEHIQEELFVVLEGTATMLLGDPFERVELPCGSICVVETETVLQLRNESAAEVVVLVVGAPPEAGGADHLPDVEL